MKILHGTWIPSCQEQFIQNGRFYLWVEIPQRRRKSSKQPKLHPRQLTKEGLANFHVLSLGMHQIHNQMFDIKCSMPVCIF